ncbi:diacylglycerol kinase family protein [Foetidibacter luteolus]|uniref:diacylglycerol kinase family protein n=1 Tax=Foetidibacter luteolus TaxID=2608880 RepID=UPI00129A552F|nr:diacylglycerol kinase family protein [Foetidibacter luteolus]
MKRQSIISSFKNAFNGLWYFFLHERNGKVQLSAAVLATVLGYSLGVSVTEWLMLLLCMAVVLALEMVNSAIERICDLVQEDYHPVIKAVKDMAAGAVLFTAAISVVAGVVIFLPKLL